MGAGPGSYFDFATSSFQVPVNGSLCANTCPAAAKARSVIAKTVHNRFICRPPRTNSWVVPRERGTVGGRLRRLAGGRQAMFCRPLCRFYYLMAIGFTGD